MITWIEEHKEKKAALKYVDNELLYQTFCKNKDNKVEASQLTNLLYRPSKRVR